MTMIHYINCIIIMIYIFLFNPPSHSPQAGANMTLQQEFEYPMIGRDMELDLFLKEVDYIQKHQGAASQRQAIVYDGESGIGRTKLLDAAIVKALHANIK